jgi:hypothetical protein
MAVTKISTFLYLGLAGDTKPTGIIPAGAKYVQTDTNGIAIADGKGNWISLPAATAVSIEAG